MRGDGATTRQMQGAAKNALFVWVNSHFSYPRELAEKLGRDDLRIVSPSFFDNDRWRGQVFTEIVIDHAAYLNDREFENYKRALHNVRDAAGESSK